MTVLIKDIIYISTEELLDSGIVSFEYLKKCLNYNRNRKTNHWEHNRFSFSDQMYIPETEESRKGRIFIKYESLTDKYKELIKQKICGGCDPYLWVNNQIAARRKEQARNFTQSLVSMLTLDLKWTEFFIKNGYSPDDANMASRAAAWLDMLSRYDSVKKVREKGFETIDEFREAVLNAIKLEQESGLLRWASSKKGITKISTLYRIVKRWEKQGCVCLLTAKLNNDNKRVIGKIFPGDEKVLIADNINIAEWHASRILEVFMNPGKGNKFDVREVYRRYVRLCDKEGKEPRSESAMRSFLKIRPVQALCERERNGAASLDKFMPHVKRKRPELALTKGGFDGFQVDFYTDVDGSHIMLTVVAVFDYATGAVTGFDVGIVENAQMVRNMYRHHLVNCGNKSYIEIESDRFAGNLSEPTARIFRNCCQYVTMPAPNDAIRTPGKKVASNPKARYVERLIQELNRISQHMDGWKGVNITSQRSGRHANPDYHGQAAKSISHGINQVIQMINIYNNEPLEATGKSRWQEFKEKMNPAAQVILPLQAASYLNDYTETTVKNYTISITYKGLDYEWIWPEFMEQRHKTSKNDRVRVYFNPSDMSEAYLFRFEDEKDITKDVYIDKVKALKIPAEAKWEQTEEDQKEIGKQHNFRIKEQKAIYRKYLEFEASVFGIDIGNTTIEEAEKIIAGARRANPELIIEPIASRFNAGLTSEDGKKLQEYYEDVLIKKQGHRTVITHDFNEQKDIEKLQRERARAKFNKAN